MSAAGWMLMPYLCFHAVRLEGLLLTWQHIIETNLQINQLDRDRTSLLEKVANNIGDQRNLVRQSANRPYHVGAASMF